MNIENIDWKSIGRRGERRKGRYQKKRREEGREQRKSIV
jgi:hypothetical protein